MDRIWRAAVNSWNGLRTIIRTEAAFREELVLFAVGIPVAFSISGDAGRRLALIAVLLLVLIVELLNTAIEKLSDRVTLDQDPIIKSVKDMGSAAVGLSLIAAGLVWLWVLLEQIWV
ncbi:MAG TPA: diacylglycerol kinase [Pseudolabrys sp.]|nr:diacylglycerol kinase [Pseudolabrys sp.]